MAEAQRSRVTEAQRDKVRTYRDLVVWQKSMQLVTQIYLITKHLPKEEVYGLVSQIRRCCISIPSNIAEGYGRNSKNDYIRFLQIASGSLYELQTQLEICLNLNYLRLLQKSVNSRFCHGELVEPYNEINKLQIPFDRLRVTIGDFCKSLTCQRNLLKKYLNRVER